ncbi:hypothetical protein BaRGS_00009362 [Batillaria attramentaria]|uniref:Uncharacterized protein n=1 Tax=Batillaria attramentaria TaxID=370345 RepID=A0ABD0LJ82_9CAEN
MHFFGLNILKHRLIKVMAKLSRYPFQSDLQLILSYPPDPVESALNLNSAATDQTRIKATDCSLDRGSVCARQQAQVKCYELVVSALRSAKY